jgi:hypothetical protein
MQTSRGMQMSLAEFQHHQAKAPNQLYVVSGDERVLSRLPAGNWIGGTTTYLMTDGKGGLMTRDSLFVQELLSEKTSSWTISVYDENTISRITNDAPANGYTFLLIPAFSDVHLAYGKDAPNFKDIFIHPIMGWVTGVHLDELGKNTPKVFNGKTGESYDNKGIACHVRLPEGTAAEVNIANIFEQSEGPDISFEADGFTVTTCLIDGKKTNFARWLTENKVDTQLPMIADYNGARINVCVRNIDATAGTVSLYAPVFKGKTYRLAKPVPDYVKAFKAATACIGQHVTFSCNCVLNYLYGNLEGAQAGLPGPCTFGEIAYQLLNQTMVYFEVVDVTQEKERQMSRGVAKQMAHA